MTHVHRKLGFIAGWALAGAVTAMFMPAEAQSRRDVRGVLPAKVSQATPVGHFDTTQVLHFSVGLALHNQTGLNQLLLDLYDPGSPRYHQWLTPEQFADSFGPTKQEYAEVLQWAADSGFEVVGTFPKTRNIVDLRGSVSSVERALNVNEMSYQDFDGRVFHAPDREPSVSVTLPAFSGIRGLDDANPPRPRYVLAEKDTGGTLSHDMKRDGSGEGGTFSGSDLRTVYGFPSNLTGSGRYLGVMALDTIEQSDITTFENYYGIGVPVSQELLDGMTEERKGDLENTLDTEVAIGMAPGLAGLIVYSSDDPTVDYAQALSENKIDAISNSYGYTEDSTEQGQYQEFAAQGITVEGASGDDGSWAVGTNDDPDDDPNVLAVGGTSLSTNTPGGPRSSEVAWTGSGGGVTNIALPSYQGGLDFSAFGGVSSGRNLPDVALCGDPNTGFGEFADGKWQEVGGTSMSAPGWNAVMAIVAQSNGAKSGCINTKLYTVIGPGASYASAFDDIISGSNGAYSAVAGFDLTTGWGVPKVAAFIPALASGGSPPDAPTSLNATAGNAQVALSWTGSSGATSYAVYRGVSPGAESGTPVISVSGTIDTDAGLVNGVTYYYKVAAVSAGGTSALSNEANATPVAPVPSPPVGLTATSGNSQITLAWSASGGATSYNVYRGLSSGSESGTPIASGVAGLVFTNTGLTNGVTYYYTAAAVNSSGTSASSNEAHGTPILPPPAPSGLTATAGNSQVSLSWTPSGGATSYNVYRGTSSGLEGATPVVSGIGVPSFLDSGLTNGVTYYYIVASVNGGGTSAASNEASATPIPTGGGGTTHVLWVNPDNSLTLWSYNTSSGSFTQNSWGPFAGWSPACVADGRDGYTRVLWTNTNGAASIWNLNSSTGTYTSDTFGPYTGWTATSMSVGTNNSTHVLWVNTNGTASIWNYNTVTGAVTGNNYGPYSGWTPTKMADGPDGLLRVLWTNTTGAASIWSLNNVTGAFSQGTVGPYTGWTATAVSVGTDNTTHLLWDNTDGAVSIWNYSTTTDGFTQNTYGPFAGWTANAIADGPDGRLRVIWSNSNGQEQIWSLNNSTATYTNFTFGPYAAGRAARSVSVAPDDITHILWDNSNGAVSLWNYSATANTFTQATYGPFAGWTAMATADGPDAQTRVLWNTTNGQASIWSLNTLTASYVNYQFGPFPGWTAVGMSVGIDNTTHVLWVNSNGQASIWNYTATTGTYTLNTFGPFSGWTAKAIADGPDGLVRVLWVNTNGTGSLWSLNNTTGSYTAPLLGTVTGSSATALSVGTDNTTHILWTNTGGAASVWNYSTASETYTSNTFGPYPGWTATSITDGPFGLTQLLWTNTNASASVWSLNNATGAFTQGTFGPYAGWSATGMSE